MDFRARIIADLDASRAEAKLDSLTKERKVELGVNVAIRNAQEFRNLQKDARAVMREINGKNIGIKVDNKQAMQAIKQVQKEYQKSQQQAMKQSEKYSAIRQRESASYANAYTDAFQSIGKKSNVQKSMSEYYTNLEKEAIKAQQQAQKIQREIASGKFEYNNAKTESFLSKYTGQETESLDRAKKQFAEIKKLQTELLSGKLDNNGLVSTYEKLNTEVEKLGYSMKQVSVESSKTLDVGIAERGANKIATYMEQNSKAVKRYGVELDSLQQKYTRITTQAEKIDLDNQFNTLKAKISSENLTGRSWTHDFSRAFGKIFQFAGAYGLIQNVAFEVPRQLVQAVRDINAAQVELTKVSSAPTSQLTEYWDEAAISAKKYGATISDVINSTADWSRLGYSLNEAKELSDATTLMQRVGDNMTQESASQGIISTLKGFQFDASEVTRIIDEVNEVANTQPIDTSGIFAGLERSASSMDAANNSLEQTIALITAANSVVQDPDSVGTAFKTLSMRIRGKITCLHMRKVHMPCCA